MRALAICLLFAASLARAADPGPAVGARTPDFDLADQNGQRQTRAGLSGPKGLMLVFFRSADW